MLKPPPAEEANNEALENVRRFPTTWSRLSCTFSGNRSIDLGDTVENGRQFVQKTAK